MGYTISWTPLRFSDFTYLGILDILPKIISPEYKITVDANGFKIGNSDNESIYFPRYFSHWSWEKTNREPYGREAMKALILMVEYGVTTHLDHDDSDMTWFLEALETVHEIWPLISYENQKRYFAELGKRKLIQESPYPIQETSPVAQASLSQMTTDTLPTENLPHAQTMPPTN